MKFYLEHADKEVYKPITTGRHPVKFVQNSVIRNKCVYIKLYIIANLVFEMLQLL